MTEVLGTREVRKGQYVVDFICDNCGTKVSDKKTSYDRKKRHYCSMHCYAQFNRTKLPIEEHNRYGKGFDKGEQAKRRKARSDLNHHMRDKGLKRQPCEECGEWAEAHHDDYDKPLEVRWLCFKHHRAHHKAIYENPELLAPTPNKEDAP